MSVVCEVANFRGDPRTYSPEKNWIALDCILHIFIVGKIIYIHLFHALKNTANQGPGLPLHILRHATGNMQWVIYNG